MNIMVISRDAAEAAPSILAFESRGDVVKVSDGLGAWVDQCDYPLYNLVLVLLARPTYEICGELRRRGRTVPILVASELNSDSCERVKAFEAGADDCIPAPYNVQELLLRSDALIRRSANAYDYPQRLGPLVLKPRAREAFIDGRRAPLTDREFELLSILVRHAGNTVTRGEILEALWVAEPESNVLEVHIRRVRAKLGRYAPSLETVRGIGYRLVTPAARPSIREGAELPIIPTEKTMAPEPILRVGNG